MLSFVCFLAFVSYTRGACTSGANEFQGTFAEFGTENGQIVAGYSHIYYDFNNKRVETQKHTFNPTTGQYDFVGRSIRFHTPGHGYWIDNQGVCSSYTFVENLRSPGIQSGGSFLGSSYLGYQWEKIDMNSFFFTDPANADKRVFLTLSGDQCVPLVQFTYNANNATAGATTLIFTGYQTPIDPSVGAFNIPTTCPPI